MPQIASGGVSEGTINDADFFLNTGEVLFSVSQDQQPQGSLYLKVYTGTKYSNTRWKSNDDSEEKAEIFCQRAAAWLNTQGYDGAVRLTVGFPQGKSDASHPYDPYFSQSISDDGTEKEYRYYPIERIAYLFTEPADSLTDDYRDYVYQHYLDYPTKGTERMQQFVADNPGEDIEEIAISCGRFSMRVLFIIHRSDVFRKIRILQNISCLKNTKGTACILRRQLCF